MNFLSREDIEAKISQAIAEKSDSLKLDSIQTDVNLPLSILDIPNLRHLSLYESAIKIPAWICDIKSLESLELDIDTDVSEILPHLHKLENLRVLKLAHVEGFEEFPINLCHLHNLKSLNIDGAEIEKLPVELALLKKLEYFSFRAGMCKMSNVFEILAQLPNLKILYYDKIDDIDGEHTLDPITGIYMDILPPSFSNMTSLEEIHFNNWVNFKCFPDNLDKLQNLKVIDISNFDYILGRHSIISELPEAIGNLKNLETLDIYGCPRITRLPDSFVNVTTLKSLDIIHTGIRELCLTNEQWQNLEYLRMQGKMPDFAKCPNLKIFAWRQADIHYSGVKNKIVGNKELFDLPIHNLHKLEELSVYGGKLRQLDFLAGMPKLKKLHLSCDFDSLPNYIGDLADLEELDIWGATSLKSLPESLAGAKSLKRIRISDSGIREIPKFLKERKNIEVEFTNYKKRTTAISE